MRHQVIAGISGVVPITMNDLPVDGSAVSVGIDRITEVDLAGLVVVPTLRLLSQFRPGTGKVSSR